MMSLTCHEEIGRVGRGCYEDARDLCATSRACHAATDRRPTNQVSAWQAERGSRPTRTTLLVVSSRGYRACRT